MYCFLHEAGGTVIRLLPNATNPNSFMSANQAVWMPDWMSPMPGFIMDPTSAGIEHVGCFATDEDMTARLPLLQAPPLAIMPGVAGLEPIEDAFFQALGKEGFTTS